MDEVIASANIYFAAISCRGGLQKDADEDQVEKIKIKR